MAPETSEEITEGKEVEVKLGIATNIKNNKRRTKTKRLNLKITTIGIKHLVLQTNARNVLKSQRTLDRPKRTVQIH